MDTQERVEARADVMELPRVDLPAAPEPSRLASVVFVLAWAGTIIFLLDRLTLLLMDFWLLQSLGFDSVFWTNFRQGLLLFVVGTVLFWTVAAVPAYAHKLSRVAKRRAILAGGVVGMIAGYWWATSFRDYLLFFRGRPFGESDPVFGHDIGFYTFDLPAIWTTWRVVMALAFVGLISSVACAFIARPLRTLPAGMNRFVATLGNAASPYTIAMFAFGGLVAAAGIWVSRYNVLIRNNETSVIEVGAEFIDTTGFFSTVNGFTVTMLAMLFMTFGVTFTLRALHRGVVAGGTDWRARVTAVALLFVFLPGVGLDTAFRAMTTLRDETRVTVNEPNIQLEYIQRHVDATLKAFGMDDIDRVTFRPNQPGDPLPDPDELLASPTLRNAPLWPGFVSYLEDLQDPQHQQRIFLTGGDPQLYGPTKHVMEQQQQLRTYYEFDDVDTVRYHIDGEPRLFTAATRELPLNDPQPWLYLWGQRSLLFTHGHGIVMTALGDIAPDGSPVYATKGLPIESEFEELEQPNPAIYYGEPFYGGQVAFSNSPKVDELDVATDTGIERGGIPAAVDSGVQLDSLLKRAVVGYRSGNFLDVFFSDLIDGDTRVHYWRSPLERIERIAPFLWLDTDPWPVVGGPDRNITWMVNGITTADRYPYAMWADLGDKSLRRTNTPRPIRVVNYAQDSVKLTVDAYTGDVNLYSWAEDEPVLESWKTIYPDLFTEAEEMPADLREQVQYPIQLFHIMFDDLYVFYHQTEALVYFNQEDMWDDADEVKGPIIEEGEALSFSIEPYYWLAGTGGDSPLPDAENPTQFALSAVFTPEKAKNLRSIVTAYMEADDYGKIHVLEVPKGFFSIGPEQADAAIDQDAFISQQIALWNRQGLEVIRGHTTPLVVGNELLYVEPIFIKSKQNPVPQLKRVVVVFRGHAALGENLAEAVRSAINPPERFPVRPGPELGGEPGFVRTSDGIREGTREGGLRTAVPRDPGS